MLPLPWFCCQGEMPQWFPWGSESLVCQCQATKCFQGRCIQPRYNKLLGRLGGPIIEIHCSHRNTSPPCYVRIYVCHGLRFICIPFGDLGKRGSCWHSIFLKVLLFSNPWYQLAFMPLSGRNKWCGCSQQKRPSVKLEVSGSSLVEIKMMVLKKGNLSGPGIFRLLKTLHRLVPIWLRAGCLALIKGSTWTKMHSTLPVCHVSWKARFVIYFSEVSQEVESGVLHWAAHIPITGNAKGLLELRDLSHDSLKMAMGTVKSITLQAVKNKELPLNQGQSPSG